MFSMQISEATRVGGKIVHVSILHVSAAVVLTSLCRFCRRSAHALSCETRSSWLAAGCAGIRCRTLLKSCPAVTGLANYLIPRAEASSARDMFEASVLAVDVGCLSVFSSAPALLDERWNFTPSTAADRLHHLLYFIKSHLGGLWSAERASLALVCWQHTIAYPAVRGLRSAGAKLKLMNSCQ